MSSTLRYGNKVIGPENRRSRRETFFLTGLTGLPPPIAFLVFPLSPQVREHCKRQAHPGDRGQRQYRQFLMKKRLKTLVVFGLRNSSVGSLKRYRGWKLSS